MLFILTDNLSAPSFCLYSGSLCFCLFLNVIKHQNSAHTLYNLTQMEQHQETALNYVSTSCGFVHFGYQQRREQVNEDNGEVKGKVYESESSYA